MGDQIDKMFRSLRHEMVAFKVKVENLMANKGKHSLSSRVLDSHNQYSRS